MSGCGHRAGLEGGAPILAAGQLSERWVISDGRTSKRAAIVAALVHPWLPAQAMTSC